MTVLVIHKMAVTNKKHSKEPHHNILRHTGKLFSNAAVWPLTSCVPSKNFSVITKLKHWLSHLQDLPRISHSNSGPPDLSSRKIQASMLALSFLLLPKNTKTIAVVSLAATQKNQITTLPLPIASVVKKVQRWAYCRRVSIRIVQYNSEHHSSSPLEKNQNLDATPFVSISQKRQNKRCDPVNEHYSNDLAL